MTGSGAKEAELIAAVESSGLKVFTVADAARILETSNAIVLKLVHRLVQKHKLQRFEQAKYLLIPPEARKTCEYIETMKKVLLK